MNEELNSVRAIPVGRSGALDYIALAKPELTLLSVLTALGGAYLGAGHSLSLAALIHTFFGTLLVGGGAGALNQYLERDLDALMRRTEHRPLPSGRIHHRKALLLGLLLSLAGLVELALFTRMLASFLALVTLVSYLFIYTPLKRVTPFATVVGGIPGAVPPLIGWAAVSGELGMGAWSLFFILFFWQMPHFLSLSWMYRKDYARANYRLLTVLDPSGKALSFQILVYCVALIPAAVMPTVVGVLGPIYFAGALVLTLGFLALAIRLFRERTNSNARRLFFASLIYLTVLVGLMILDRIGW
jgi:protoheme IX farnesyltransferase